MDIVNIDQYACNCCLKFLDRYLKQHYLPVIARKPRIKVMTSYTTLSRIVTLSGLYNPKLHHSLTISINKSWIFSLMLKF